jgi:hypothetical protein
VTAAAFEMPHQVDPCARSFLFFIEMLSQLHVLDASIVLHDERVGN